LPVTAPGILFQTLASLEQFGPGRVQMNVIANCLQITIAAAIDRQSFIAPGEKMSAGFVADVEALGVNAQEPFHAGNEVCLGSFDDQMKMIPHQAPGMHLPPGFGASLAKRFQKALPVRRIANYVLPLIAAAHHMINRAREFNSQFSGNKPRVINISVPSPYFN
jgi:hypothetical protein